MIYAVRIQRKNAPITTGVRDQVESCVVHQGKGIRYFIDFHHKPGVAVMWIQGQNDSGSFRCIVKKAIRFALPDAIDGDSRDNGV